ncbi:MAG: hypothetical protein A2798_00525 [Candidatus Levybacteria bacterium RIFCSPHIGHO2_01_FULL_37_17]|nr:MAG: hypothetical protein A2798_00525 [Candidatus Levybacteria bacterium RIFCSPHIGHO2_01_FULL_37_17]OGH36428.1 MAG: hypothetical protein A2959_02840 [Candidatus Levybacteria bacterium RIFCSPLOWO2_01_FULL_38_23]
MNSPALVTKEFKSEFPVLVVDKIGILGAALAEKIKDETLVILVSAKKQEDPNIIHIPYERITPSIPDNTYSHIFLIDEDGVLSKSMITPFVKKAEHDGSELVLVLRRDMLQDDFADSFISSYDKAKIVITGDIFASDYIFDSSTDINRFIKHAKENKKIEIAGEGLRQTFPVFVEDAVWGILQAGFIEKDDRAFKIYPSGYTLLSISRILQKIDPDLKINFVEDKSSLPKGQNEHQGKMLLDKNYDLEARIKKIKFEKAKFEEVERRKESKPSIELIRFSGLSRFIAVSLLTLFLVLIMPIFFTLISFFAGALLLQGAKIQVEKGQFESSKNYTQSSYYAFIFSHSSFPIFLKEASFVGLEGKALELSTKIDQGKEASFAILSFFKSVDKIKRIFDGSASVSEKEFSEVADDIKLSLVFYQKQKNNGVIPESISKKFEPLLTFTSATIESWPEILGFKGERKYLILLQNNMELRATGGFIGSFAITRIKNGKLTNFKIYDVYDADGQLKGHIEPPFAIRRYLSSPNWYLRDSNFDIDFSQSAQASAVFLQTELKETVDGVLAVDLSFVRSLLETIGDVKVLDYNETVNSDNLFQLTQAKVEENFFPGSKQKKDFLRSLYVSIQTKLSSDKTTPYLNVLQSAIASVSEKHILFAFNKVNVSSLFSVNGWGGTLFDDRKKSDATINDFVGINESNFGANKVNYYLSRSQNLSTTIAENGEVTNVLKLSYKNNAPKSLNTKGLYKNYLRLILPFASQISKVEIDGIEQSIIPAVTQPSVYEATNFKPPQGLEIEVTENSAKSVFGMLLNIEPEALKTITITYKLASKLNLNQASFNYSLKAYKQPGIDNIPFGFSLNLPSFLTVVDYPKEAGIKSNGASFSSSLRKDSDFIFNLSKK